MHDEALLTPYSVWRHSKGGLYTVIGVSTQSTNGPGDGFARVVVYCSNKYGKLRHRDLPEFLDGRFTPVKE